MNAFRDPTPEEAKMIALQFMGQNLGEIKELDKNIVSKNATLKGNTLNVQAVLNSFASPNIQQQPAPLQQQSNRPWQAPAPASIGTPIANNDALVTVLNKVASLLETITKLLEKQ